MAKVMTRSTWQGQGHTRNAQFELALWASCNRKSVITHGRQRGFGSESLEHAIQAINKVIFEYEQRRQRQRARRAAEGKGGLDVEVQPVSKPITFKASAKSEKLVKEPPGPSPSPRGLAAYLALPLDQYSLLDPEWISRSPSAPDVFVLRIPLFDLVGLELQPQISVKVALDPRNAQVHFHADQFRVGDPRVDEDFKLAMRATLRSKPVPTIRPFRSIKRMWAGRAGNRAGAAAGSSAAAGGRDTTAASPAGQSTSPWAGSPPTAPASQPGGHDGDVASSSFETEDTEADEIVVQVVEGEIVDEGGGEDGGSGGAAAAEDERRARNGSAATSGTVGGAVPYGGAVYAEFRPVGVADQEVMTRGSAASPASVATPSHGADGHGVGTTTATGEASSFRRIQEPSAVAAAVPRVAQSSSVAVAEIADRSSNTSSGSSCSSSIMDSSNSSRVGRDAALVAGGNSSSSSSSNSGHATTARVTADSSSSSGGAASNDNVQCWPPGVCGPSHPATAASASAATAVVVAAAVTTTSAAAPSSLGQSSSTGVASPAAPPSAPSRQVLAAGPAAVAVASTAPSPATESTSGTAAAPFIEDSVLYVPASQWGRTGGGAATGGAPPGPPSTSASGRAASAATATAPTTAAPSSATVNPISPLASIAAAAAPKGAIPGSAPHGLGSPSSSAYLAKDVGTANGAGGSAVVTSSIREGTAAAAAGPGPSGSPAPAALAGGGGGDSISPCGELYGDAAAGTLQTEAAGGLGRTVGPVGGDAAVVQGTTGTSGATAAAGSSSEESMHTASASDAAAAAAAAAPLAVSAASAGAPAEEGPTSLLAGSVDVAVTVMLPPALAAVPRPLLGMTGSLIARYAIASLLPSFLDLLVADYKRWSTGQTVAARATPAGDLAAVAAANAAAMGATAPGARSQQGQQPPHSQQAAPPGSSPVSSSSSPSPAPSSPSRSSPTSSDRTGL